ncbi:MAG: hypothetical protein LBS01_01005 [Prevotellaceae bacterium]|nr:hypothetical protein [Prevotellaceae bacterium]
MQSPYGRRGSICAHLGWTWDYLHHEIAWNIVQRIMIDAPNVGSDTDKVGDIKITDENADKVLKQINQLTR